MSTSIEDLTPAQRTELIGRSVTVSVSAIDPDGVAEGPAQASQTGRLSVISEDSDKILVAFGSEVQPLIWDKHQFTNEVVVGASSN